MIWIHPALLAALPAGVDLNEYFLAQTGTLYRAQPGRRLLRFELAGEAYFVKIHTGVGWQEILKNLLRLRKPVLGARNEWMALERLENTEVRTAQLMGYGERGKNPATRESFVITKDLAGMISLETLIDSGLIKTPKQRRRLIHAAARLSADMHAHGVFHRDFYCCHLMIHAVDLIGNNALKLHVIDLHRAELSRRLTSKQAVRDLGALYFSTLMSRLSRGDKIRFVSTYTGKAVREVLKSPKFQHRINARALQIERREQRRSHRKSTHGVQASETEDKRDAGWGPDQQEQSKEHEVSHHD